MAAITPISDNGKSDCKECGEKEKKCADLENEIWRRINGDKSSGGGLKGLKQRFSEQINGNLAPGTTGPMSWESHDNTIKEQQNGLREKLQDWDKNGCGPPPEGSWSWATKPAPSTKEWIGNKYQASPATNEGLSTWQWVGVGVGVVALSAIAILSFGTAIPAEGAVLASVGGGLLIATGQ